MCWCKRAMGLIKDILEFVAAYYLIGLAIFIMVLLFFWYSVDRVTSDLMDKQHASSYSVGSF